MDARLRLKVLEKRKQRMDDIGNALKNQPDKSSISDRQNSDGDMNVIVKTEADKDADEEDTFRIELDQEYSQVTYYLPQKYHKYS